MRHRDPYLISVEGRLRGMALMVAAERAALTPIPLNRLHALAYLADVLSPIWDLEPFDKVALKTTHSPFFSSFQKALDRLVLEGMLEVSAFGYERSDDGNLELRASYALRHNDDFVRGICEFFDRDDLYAPTVTFFTSLAIAISRLPDEQIEKAANKDAAWENIEVAADYLIELANPLGKVVHTATSSAIEYFDEQAPVGAQLGRSAHLQLYATYLSQRLRAA